MSGKRFSFKSKLIAFTMMVSAVPVILLGFISSYIFSKSLQREVDLHQQSILKNFESQLNNYLSRIDEISISLATSPIVLEAAERGVSMKTLDISLELMDTLRNLVGNSDLPIDISLIFPTQNTVYSQTTGLVREIYYPFSEINRLVWNGTITSYRLPPQTFANQNDLLIVRPVPLNSSAPKGVLVVHLKSALLVKMIERMAPPLQRILLVLDDRNRPVVSGQTWSSGGAADPTAQIVGLVTASRELPDQIELNGESFIMTATQSSANGWKYVAIASTQELSRQSHNMQRIAWLLAGGLAIIWAGAAIVGSNRLYSPLQRLVNKFSPRSEGHAGLFVKRAPDIIDSLDFTIQQLHDNNERLMVRLNEQMPLVKEHVLLQLLHGKMTDPDIPDQVRQAELAPLRGELIYVCIAEIDQWHELKQMYGETDRSLIVYALRKRIEELGAMHYPILGISPKPGQVVFVLAADEPEEVSFAKIKQLGEQLCQQIDREFPFSLSVAIAGPRKGLEHVQLSYEEAQSLMSYRLAKGPQSLITRESIESTLHAPLGRLIVHEQAITAAVAQGCFEEAYESLDELVREAGQSIHSSATILALFTHLLGELERLLAASDIELSGIIGEEALGQLSGMHSLALLHQWMRDTVLTGIQHQLEELHVPRRKKLVQHAVSALQQQLEEDISLQSLAEQMGVSRATLSKWFKEETGLSFSEFLIQLRMTRAKEWLSSSELPIRVIAERLRYTSVTNFTRIFKQSTGTTPGAFRNRYIASEE